MSSRPAWSTRASSTPGQAPKLQKPCLEKSKQKQKIKVPVCVCVCVCVYMCVCVQRK